MWERACSRRRCVSQCMYRLTCRFRGQARSHRGSVVLPIVPTLCVGMHPVTLCVMALKADAERPGRHSHAERGNDQRWGLERVTRFEHHAIGVEATARLAGVAGAHGEVRHLVVHAHTRLVAVTRHRRAGGGERCTTRYKV